MPWNEREAIRVEKLEARLNDLERAIAALNRLHGELAVAVLGLRSHLQDGPPTQ